MIYVICRECRAGLRISPGEVDEPETLFGESSDFYPNKYPCFRCERPIAEFVPAIEPLALQALEVFDVTPKEAFAAMHGLGLPGEQDCSAAAVSQLFEDAGLKVKARTIRNSHRCIVDYVQFEDGTRVYLGSSALGAVAYRVAKPHSYAAQL